MRMRLAIVVWIAATGAASAQGQATAPQALNLEFSRPITVDFKDIRLSQALRVLGRAAGVKISLAPDVDDVRVVEAMFVNVSFEDAFNSIVRGECLAYKVTGPRSVVVTTASSGGKSKAHGPRVIVWPNCTDDYVPPVPLEVRAEGFQRLAG